MMKSILSLVLFTLMCLQFLHGQESQETVVGLKISDSVVDHMYREDQFYISVTYNLLGNKPDGVSQSGFSSGFHIGFIRDLPINKRRNRAIGIGLGFSTNSYNQTLKINEDNVNYTYTVLNDVSFSKNKFTTYLLELPVEFRWRTSTPIDYDFWRIYVGFKLGYMIYNSSKFNGDPSIVNLSNIDDFNKFQYGLTFSSGYSNVNFRLYYALSNLFNDQSVVENSDENVTMNAIKIGLIFYIL